MRLSVKVDEAAFTKAKSKIDGLKQGFLKLGAVVSTAAAGLQALAYETANAAREASNTAKQTGLSTQHVQALGFAAEQSGVSAEEMRHGLVHLARSAMEARSGSADAALGFQQLGVRAVGADGKIRPMGELLADVTQKIAAMPDGTQKAALAMRLFGRAGAQLIPLFNRGSAGMAAMSSEADRLGVTMSDQLIKSGVKYAETLGSLKGALQGVGNAIMSRLFPAMTRSTAQFREWLVVHRKWIALHVEQAFKVVTEVLQSFVRVAKGVVDLFERIWKSGGAGKAAIIGLGVAVTAMVAPWTALAGVIALVAEDIELFFSSHGKAKTVVGLLVMAFELLAKKVSAVWNGFKEDPFGTLRKWATGFFDWFAEQAAALPDRIAKAVGQKNMKKWSDFILKDLGLDFTNMVMPEGARGGMDDLFAPKQDAFYSAPGGKFAYPMIDGDRYQVDAKTGAGQGMGPVNFNVQVTAGPGTDGAQVGQDIWSTVAPKLEDWHNTKLREAHASVNR